MSETRTYYSMTAAQKILFYSQKFTLYKQVNNIFTLLLVEKELDFSILRKAIEYAYSHCDCLRIRLTKVQKEVKQYFLKEVPPLIDTLDFTGQTLEQMDKRLYKLASKPFLIINRPLCKMYMIRSCDGMSGLYFGVSHMILDSWGICVVMKYVMDVYTAMKDNADMPKPLYPHESLLAIDLAYKDTPQYQKDLEFWKQECTRDEPWYTHINGPSVLEAYRKKKKNPNLQGSSGFTFRTKAHHEIITIPKSEIEAMEAFCTANKIPMQSLFLLAFRTCLSRLNKRQPDVSFYSIVARRGTLHEKYSGGTRVHTLLFRTILEENRTFMDAVQAVQNRLSVLFRHAEFDALDVMKMMENAYHPGDAMASHLAAALTFQPVKLTLNDGTLCHSKWYGNGVSSQPFYLTIMDDDGSGGLRCYYEYQRSIVAQKTIVDFHNDMVKIILAGVRNPEITVGQLLDLEKVEDISAAPVAETAASVAIGE